MPATPAASGWYRDPDDALRHRYWDGERWYTQCERLAPRREHDGPDCGDGATS